ncbi:MAG: hypothetical protein R6U41_06490 [Desulfosalsimonas sp.]|uniref:hypothetical protein n=1 Tax=Desulfosalsimonas sp. TaxID=3073848 RepID=UPI003970B019
MKEQLYKKELRITVLFVVILMIFGHFAQIFKLFPSLQEGSMWGFPVHYIMPILMGWFGLLILAIIMAVVLNKFDDDMDAYTSSLEDKNSGDTV